MEDQNFAAFDQFLVCHYVGAPHSPLQSFTFSKIDARIEFSGTKNINKHTLGEIEWILDGGPLVETLLSTENRPLLE